MKGFLLLVCLAIVGCTLLSEPSRCSQKPLKPVEIRVVRNPLYCGPIRAVGCSHLQKYGSRRITLAEGYSERAKRHELLHWAWYDRGIDPKLHHELMWECSL